MYVVMRRFAAVVVGVGVLVGLSSATAQAQAPIGVPPNPGLNPFFNPGAMAGMGLVGNASAFGMGAPGAWGGFHGLGVGSLAASYAGSRLGYGSLLNRGLGYGGGYGGMGYGMGFATQWMLNPYTGYLSGAASVTTANANYWKTIAEARLQRQEYLRSTYQTRRAAIEEAEWERAHMPDPEKIRQEQLARALDRARHQPPATEIWSGRSINDLLGYLMSQQGKGARGPDVPLSEDMLKSINLTSGDSRGNAGLLKNKGKLQWPLPLQGDAFKESREGLNRNIQDAVNTVSSGNDTPPPNVLKDLKEDLKKLNDNVDAGVSTLSPDQWIEARRYLRKLNDAVTALENGSAANVLNNKWSAQGVKNVAELVKYMRENGLRFGEAAPRDEAAYTALYHALAAFDAGLSPVGGNSDKNDNK